MPMQVRMVVEAKWVPSDEAGPCQVCGEEAWLNVMELTMRVRGDFPPSQPKPFQPTAFLICASCFDALQTKSDHENDCDSDTSFG